MDLLDPSRVRFEIIPIKSKSGTVLLPKNMKVLPKKSVVTITCSENIGFDATLQTTKRIADIGHIPVPHIPARMVKDLNHLKHIVHELEKLEVHNIFVPGGDAPVPVGEFSSSLELLEVLNTLPHSFQDIGITAYPQGHTDIPKKILFEAFLAKQKHATYAVTQISSSLHAVEKWLISMCNKGIDFPIYAGVIGYVERKRMMRIANNFDLKKVIWFLRKNPHIAFQAGFKGSYSPYRIIKGLSSFGNVAGIHFNTFNSVENTELWRKKITS